MQLRANKEQSCKDKEWQSNFMEYPIFFSHHLALRRKSGRLPYNLWRDKEPVTGTWRMTLGLHLQRKNMSWDPHQKGKRQPWRLWWQVSWPWMHERCDGRLHLRQVLSPIRALPDKDAYEKTGRYLSGRWAMVPSKAFCWQQRWERYD